MEVIDVNPKNTIKLVGTYVIVGAASSAGAALWTKVLQGKCSEVAQRVKAKKSNKVIDFKQAKKRLSHG